MDSLLASYASSEEDEDQRSSSSLIASNSSPSFSASQPGKSSALFSSLPAPKLQIPSVNLSGEDQNRLQKRVVQFRPPVPAKRIDSDEEDEVEEEKEKKRRREPQLALEASSFLRSIPAPKHSASVLGSGAWSSSGSGRRSIVLNDAPAISSSEATDADTCLQPWTSDDSRLGEQSSTNDASGSVEQSWTGDTSGYDGLPFSSIVSGPGNESGYGSHEYCYPQQFSVPQSDGSMSGFLDTAGFPVTKRRGKKDVPAEIVEIKQDDLTKDRPRADQAKLTGIAFGPGYQPQSTKGKPSKLHKRKHQIGSLFFDMKQKESEFAERRARGLLTKAQTQGKYGW